MKQASDIKQCQSLGALKNFPEPDLIIEYFWASDSHPYHLKSDEKRQDDRRFTCRSIYQR